MTKIQIAALLCTASPFLFACDREHMSDQHGRKTREFFARQHVYADATAGSPKGLDSEEAALIQGSYRKSLGAKDNSNAQGAASQVLLLQEKPDAKP